MSVALLGGVYSRVRTLLNDDAATNWPDFVLHKKAILAFEELETELILAGIPIINSISTIMTVPAMTIDDINLDLSTVPGYPTDMILPIWVKERQVNQMQQDFVDMVECDFIPQIDLNITLGYWAWMQNTIMLRGALNSVQVQLRYQRLLPVPDINTDSIVVPLGQLFLSYKIAAMASDSVGDAARKADFNGVASMNLDRIIRMNIKQLQDTPAKRRPYHRGQGRNRVLRDI
jgi:hypothetical protein